MLYLNEHFIYVLLHTVCAIDYLSEKSLEKEIEVCRVYKSMHKPLKFSKKKTPCVYQLQDVGKGEMGVGGGGEGGGRESVCM
jgi:hypothetical protein